MEGSQLGGVGLDVFPNEPEVNPRLLEFGNATLLPHMGTETCDSQKKMEIRALTNLRDFVAKGKGTDIIPEHAQYVPHQLNGSWTDSGVSDRIAKL